MFFAYIMQYRNTYICSCSILYLVYYVLYFHWGVSHCQGHSTSIALQMPGEIIPVDEIQKYHSWTDSLSKYKNIIFALRVVIRLEGWSCRWWWPDMISMCGPLLHGGYHADSCEILLACTMSWRFPEGPTYIPCSCRHILYGTKIQTPKILTAKIRTPKIQLQIKALLRGPNLLPNFPCSSTHILSCPKKLLLFYFGYKSNPDRAIYLQHLARLFIANHLNCIGYCYSNCANHYLLNI